jgi:hypothetical protein
MIRFFRLRNGALVCKILEFIQVVDGNRETSAPTANFRFPAGPKTRVDVLRFYPPVAFVRARALFADAASGTSA